MSATVYLADSFAGMDSIDCEEVRLVGDVLLAVPADGDSEFVVPTENVLGVEGDEVQQEVEDLESPGGRFWELTTDIQ